MVVRKTVWLDAAISHTRRFPVYEDCHAPDGRSQRQEGGAMSSPLRQYHASGGSTSTSTAVERPRWNSTLPLSPLPPLSSPLRHCEPGKSSAFPEAWQSSYTGNHPREQDLYDNGRHRGTSTPFCKRLGRGGTRPSRFHRRPVVTRIAFSASRWRCSRERRPGDRDAVARSTRCLRASAPEGFRVVWARCTRTLHTFRFRCRE